MDAGAKMFQELEAIGWDTCANCRERYICVKLGPRNHKCSRCMQNPFLFADENDLSPSEPPACLSRLSPIEKSAISLICPVISIYKRGISTASKGHTISIMQDVNALGNELPWLPENLPYIIIKGPNERLTDQMFRVDIQQMLFCKICLKLILNYLDCRKKQPPQPIGTLSLKMHQRFSFLLHQAQWWRRF